MNWKKILLYALVIIVAAAFVVFVVKFWEAFDAEAFDWILGATLR